MKKILSMMLTLMMLSGIVTVLAEDDAGTEPGPVGSVLRPVDVVSGFVESDGMYQARVTDGDRILDSGYFILELYAQDLYPEEAVKALGAGDKILVAGQEYTIRSLQPVEAGMEIFPEEEFDGYIVLENDREGYYIARVNDWVPATKLMEKIVMMPLPDSFSFIWIAGGDDEDVLDADAFVQLFAEGIITDELNQYNTIVRLEDGVPVVFFHADYPYGPEEE